MVCVFDHNSAQIRAAAEELTLAGFDVHPVAAQDGVSAVLMSVLPTAVVATLATWQALGEELALFKEEYPSVPVLVVEDGEVSPAGLLEILEGGADRMCGSHHVVETLRSLRVGPAKGPRSELTMNVADHELGHVLQFLALSGRQGVLQVVFDRDRSRGICHLANYRVVHVEYLSQEGVPALAEMMNAGTATAHFESTTGAPPEATITTGVDTLLIEASVQADETRVSW